MMESRIKASQMNLGHRLIRI